MSNEQFYAPSYKEFPDRILGSTTPESRHNSENLPAVEVAVATHQGSLPVKQVVYLHDSSKPTNLIDRWFDSVRTIKEGLIQPDRVNKLRCLYH